jgi:uridine phosphorylase
MSAQPPIHLNPATDVADRVLLPGDPQRALAVAQALLESPKMLNTRRGLWGYTGVAPDGELLTVQSTGMGGPSAAIVVRELIDLGARTLLRIGTCGALTDGSELGDLLAVEDALAHDGASRALGAGDRVGADPGLLEALVASGGVPSTVVSTDLFYDPREDLPARWVEGGAVAVEMEAATVLAIGARTAGVRAGCLLLVTDLLAGGRLRMDQEQVEAGGVRLGRTALEALLALSPR